MGDLNAEVSPTALSSLGIGKGISFARDCLRY